jgi:hypothetical protein
MKIHIENYRGFDIEFDTNNEIFQCICTDDKSKQSKSFSAVKKFVDEYKKDNSSFNTFWVQLIPEKSYCNLKKAKIIGLRKDGRFICEDEKGQKTYISDYDISNYMLLKEENAPIIKEYDAHEKEIEKYRVESNEKRKKIIEKLVLVNLKDYKKELLK